MKKLLYTISLILLITNCFSQTLKGSYTIGQYGAYKTFNSAVNALKTKGVSGAVVFKVMNGTYDEQFEIPPITGASSANTITFQSATGDSTDVILKHSYSTSAKDYVIYLNGADYIGSA